MTVASGHKMISKAKCVGFTWAMQGCTFSFNIRLLDLGGYCMVLGVDWMKPYSPLTFDCENLKFHSIRKGSRLNWLDPFSL